MELHDRLPATVLVIDDNPTNLNVLSDYLADAGFTVLLKRDAHKALKLLERKTPDIILLDVVMPGMDGFETCAYLKSHAATQDIPVIFMTALSETVDKLKGFELGAVDYITKPFQHEEVLARVKAHITIQQLRTDLQKKNMQLHAALEREKKMIEDLRLNLSISLPHELRTPLTAILGYAGFLHEKERFTQPDNVQRMGKQIYENALRLHRLVENALLYANLKLMKYNSDDHQQWEERSSVAVRPFIYSIARQRARNAGREADLMLELSESYVRIAPVNFEKILSELLDNAFKFSPSGTPVTITNMVNGNLCLITIADKGRGMKLEQIGNIGAYMQFERRIYEQQGSGLGLVISHLLTQLEGGMLSLESEVGQGTSVSLVLNRGMTPPALEGAGRSYWFTSPPSAFWDASSRSQQIKTLQKACTRSIVLISDVWENCSLLDYALEQSGCDIINAFDEIDGLNKIMEYQPNFTFIDGGMLDADGVTILQQIRQVAPEVKIYVFASQTNSLCENETMRPLCDEWFHIPIPVETLLSKIVTPDITPESSSILFPPDDEVARLHSLISHGDIKNFLTHLETIEQSDDRYAAFIETLRKLARDFQMKQIRTFLETPDQ